MSTPFHVRLNPKFWNNGDLRPEIRVRLLRTAIAFYQFLDLPGLKIDDIRLTGSNAAYNYAETSDCDLHLVADHAQSGCPDIVAGFFDSKRMLWNQTHAVELRGHQVELYVEDRERPAYASGVYSVLRGVWIKRPTQQRPRLDDAALTRKVASLRAEADDLLGRNPRPEQVDSILARLAQMRKTGLEVGGEFSIENLAYKLLRAEGVLERLRNSKREAMDRDLSL